MANCVKALMGALYLDGETKVVDKIFAETVFKKDLHILEVWTHYSPDPLQEDPVGDRKWIPNYTYLQKLTEFEDSTGIDFKHIRLLARAFTDRSVDYTHLTMGTNQRSKFLGDSILQLIVTEFLYEHFPEDNEGHLTLIRSSMIRKITPWTVCGLGISEYAVYADSKAELQAKDCAVLLRAFLGALYLDQGMDPCKVVCNVFFFSHIQQYIIEQNWNSPKSRLQQWCFTQRIMQQRNQDQPVYKVFVSKGPSSKREYIVAVYFRGSQLAKASGRSIQEAEVNAAKKALAVSHDLSGGERGATPRRQ